MVEILEREAENITNDWKIMHICMDFIIVIRNEWQLMGKWLNHDIGDMYE